MQVSEVRAPLHSLLELIEIAKTEAESERESDAEEEAGRGHTREVAFAYIYV
jgi:hypothetical protein